MSQAGRHDAVTAMLRPVIGARATERLLLSFAGRQLWIPREVGEHHPIAAAIGADKARTLCDHFHGTWISVPVAQAKRARILDLKRAGLSNGQIAAQLLCTERFVYQVLADAREAAATRRQHDLFT